MGMNMNHLAAAAALLVATAAAVAGPSYDGAERSVSARGGAAGGYEVQTTVDTGAQELRADISTDSANVVLSGQRSTLDSDGVVATFGLEILSGVTANAGNALQTRFTLGEAMNYDLRFGDMTGDRVEGFVDLGGEGARFSSSVSLTGPDGPRVDVAYNATNDAGRQTPLYTGIGPDFSLGSQSATGTLPAGTYALTVLHEATTLNGGSVQAVLNPLILTFAPTNDGNDLGEATVVPLPAAAWAGLATLTALGGLGWLKKR
jgi:hypothetical protein